MQALHIKQMSDPKTKKMITNVLLLFAQFITKVFSASRPSVRSFVRLYLSYVLNALNAKWMKRKKQKRFLALLNIMSYMGISLHNVSGAFNHRGAHRAADF